MNGLPSVLVYLTHHCCQGIFSDSIVSGPRKVSLLMKECTTLMATGVKLSRILSRNRSIKGAVGGKILAKRKAHVLDCGQWVYLAERERAQIIPL
ncbi:hypothetical protein KM043_013863 [Ampulex compressa]|nr:hypothetical protein KM043_013863 [Ampulex compressa]